MNSPLWLLPSFLEPFDCLQVLDSDTLHVLRPPSIDVSVLLLDGLKRIILPALPEDWDDIGVGVEQ